MTLPGFDPGDLADRAKTGIFLGSIASGLVGVAFLRSRKPVPDPSVPTAEAEPVQETGH